VAEASSPFSMNSLVGDRVFILSAELKVHDPLNSSIVCGKNNLQITFFKKKLTFVKKY
jgi:hypothetical protein